MILIWRNFIDIPKYYLLTHKTILYKIVYFFSLLFFTDILSASTSIFINQLGYLPESRKFVFANQPLDSFYVIDVKTNLKVFESSFKLWILSDVSTGLNLYLGEFSSLKQPGQYLIISKNLILQ